MNNWTISGNLGRDAELRQVGDTSVLNMNVAVNERVKRNGAWENETLWVSVAVFGNRAEALNRLGLTKGTKVIAVGRAKVRTYDKRDGTTGVSLELNASDIELVGGKRDGERRDEQPRNSGAPATAWDDPPADDFGSDDIPF